MTNQGDETRVVLKGGVVASAAAIDLLCDLERAGLRIAITGSTVSVTPTSSLTEAQRAGITTHGRELRLLISYCDQIDHFTHAGAA